MTASQEARAETALRDREAAAVQVHASTFAPQTSYSTPALAWRPDGSGVWVNGDDGSVRGIEASSGKVVVTLGRVVGAVQAKPSHDPGCKVRCLAAGLVDVESGRDVESTATKTGGRKEEWLATGGFDRKLIVWRPSPARTAGGGS